MIITEQPGIIIIYNKTTLIYTAGGGIDPLYGLNAAASTVHIFESENKHVRASPMAKIFYHHKSRQSLSI